MADRIEIQGDQELASSLHVAAKALGQMDSANRSAAEVIVRGALARVPRRTGKLAGSIGAESDRDGAAVVVRSPYAGYVEYGTRFTRAQPYLNPAVTDTQTQWEREYQAGVDDALGKVHGA